ncbi:hypothetical protein F5Y13DRAFT_194771 [Hypoxylon sp. FL1857]|nr:hypothetical protein F5Y13DRAFT_194771 [Hypoxylon sp. FL1857]
MMLAYAAVAAAAPTNSTRASLEEITEIIKEHGAEDLIKRVDVNSYKDQLPGCDPESDPSYKPMNSVYKIDQGVKIPRVGNNDACNGGKKSDHCWTEYWLVEAQIEYDNWVNSGAAIDCKTTARCGSQDSESSQSCTSIQTSKSSGYDVKMLDLALQFALPVSLPEKISLGGSLSYHWDTSKSESTTVCTTTSADNTCFWDDQKCHQVWFAQRNRRLYGYAARVCEGKTKSKVQQQTQNKDGHWVRGIVDFSFKLPVNKIIGCSALCDDQKYVEPKPQNENPVKLDTVEGW